MLSAEISRIQEQLKQFQDPLFVFDEAAHAYTYDGKPMAGTTTYLKRFGEPFDQQGKSLEISIRESRSQADVLADWEISKFLGTWVHEGIEDYWRGKPHVAAHQKELLPGLEEYLYYCAYKLGRDRDAILQKLRDEVEVRMAKFFRYAETYLGALTPIALEARLFNVRWGIAGTMDALFEYGGKLYVGDWKSNKNFSTFAYANKDGSKPYLYEPFQKWQQSNLSEYSIQLSIYRLLLEEAGIKTHGAFLCWIGPGNNAVQVHQAKDFTNVLRGVLDGTTKVGVKKQEGGAELFKLEELF